MSAASRRSLQKGLSGRIECISDAEATVLAEALRLFLRGHDKPNAGWRCFAISDTVLVYPFLVAGASIYDLPDILQPVMDYLVDWSGDAAGHEVFEPDAVREYGKQVAQEIQKVLRHG